MANELLEKILHSKKVPYERLLPLINPYINKQKIEQNVNIFVDVYDMLKQLYNPHTIQSFSNLKNADRFAIISELINIISHYRHFFASRYSKYTTFYFFFSDKPSEYHINLFKDYRKDFYEKRFNTKDAIFGGLNTVVLNSLKMLTTIIQYIPHAYCINTGSFESNVIPNFILSNCINENDMNLIISNDELFYQDLLIKDNILLLELRSEKTRIVTKENMYDSLLESTKKSSSDFPNVLSDSFNIVIPFVSHSNYNIGSVKNMGYTRALGFIQKGIDKDIISPLSTYMNNDILKDLLIKLGLNSDEISKYQLNYSLINHQEIVEKNFNSYRNIYETNIIDRVDAKGIRTVNEKYFSKNPILIDYCFEGEKY